MKSPLTPQRRELKALSINQKLNAKKPTAYSLQPTALKVVELFAGVGGFRIALEGFPKKKEPDFKVVWSNQFEPRSNVQHANIVYQNRWLDANHSEEDIENLVQHQMHCIPEHDLLVGGFPCQDFSIANRTHNKGIEGKKGKLWWSINAILKSKRPSHILLENVDRLLRSPASQKGRDFSLILWCLNRLGYAIEWRVINAADYGFPQRRRRVFIIGYHRKTNLYETIENTNPKDWILRDGISAKAFPVNEIGDLKTGKLPISKKEIMNSFVNTDCPFEKAGLMIEGNYYSIKTKPNYGK